MYTGYVVLVTQPLQLQVPCVNKPEIRRNSVSRLRDEMRYFLFDLRVDAMFTDNPDQFPAK
jgi:hypothetical protein